MRAGGLEVALVGTLLGSFLTIPVRWAHLTFGVAFVVLLLAHIRRRRHVYLAVLRRRRRRAVVSTVLVASAVVMTVSGVVQWAGVATAIPWHGASSMLLILLATGHAIRRVRSYSRWEGFVSVREWGAVVRRARWSGLLVRR